MRAVLSHRTDTIRPSFSSDRALSCCSSPSSALSEGCSEHKGLILRYAFRDWCCLCLLSSFLLIKQQALSPPGTECSAAHSSNSILTAAALLDPQPWPPIPPLPRTATSSQGGPCSTVPSHAEKTTSNLHKTQELHVVILHCDSQSILFSKRSTVLY